MSFTNNPGRFAGLLYLLTSNSRLLRHGLCSRQADRARERRQRTANNIATFETLFFSPRGSQATSSATPVLFS